MGNRLGVRVVRSRFSHLVFNLEMNKLLAVGFAMCLRLHLMATSDIKLIDGVVIVQRTWVQKAASNGRKGLLEAYS